MAFQPVGKSADSGFRPTIRRFGGDPDATAISVERELTDLGLPGLVLLSSDRRQPRTSDERWSYGLSRSVDDRLRGFGIQKGRAIAIWQGRKLVAVCCWHLHEEGPLVILDLGSRLNLSEATRKLALTVLLMALRDIAGALGRDSQSLRWADLAADRVSDRAERRQMLRAIRTRAENLGFHPLRPRPKWMAGRWVTERRF